MNQDLEMYCVSRTITASSKNRTAVLEALMTDAARAGIPAVSI